HADSFRDNPIVFITTCTARRRKFLACSEVHEILRGIWMRSAKHDGWWVGHYILMPDHLHLFARPEIDADPMANWLQMWKSVSSRRIAAISALMPPIWQADYFDRSSTFCHCVWCVAKPRRSRRRGAGCIRQSVEIALTGAQSREISGLARPFLLEASKHRKMNWRVCARRKPR